MPYYWAKRTFRKPEEKALNFSYTFLGVRLECAQCHKHPFDQWTQDDFTQFTAFFGGIAYRYNRDAQPRAQEMMKELGVVAKNNNLAQRELATLVHDGKTSPGRRCSSPAVGKGSGVATSRTMRAGRAGAHAQVLAARPWRSSRSTILASP